MTLTSTVFQDNYIASPAQTDFVITFPFIDVVEIRCWENEVEVFAGAGDDDFVVTGGSGSGGTLAFNTGRGGGQRISIRRNTLRTQQAALIGTTVLPGESIEDSLDRAAMRDQETDYFADPERYVLAVLTGETIPSTQKITELSGTVLQNDGVTRFLVRGQIQTTASGARDFRVNLLEDDVLIARSFPIVCECPGPEEITTLWAVFTPAAGATIDIEIEITGDGTGVLGVNTNRGSVIEIIALPLD